jgi:hypothetical protein
MYVMNSWEYNYFKCKLSHLVDRLTNMLPFRSVDPFC